MSWRSEVATIAKTSIEYKYDPKANEHYSFWLPYLPINAFKLSSPMHGNLHIPPGSACFVIFRPTIYRWLGINRVKLVLGHPNHGSHHGDLARKRNVIATGIYTAELQEPKKFLRRRRTAITYIDNYSGHYWPGAESVDITEKVFRTFNVPLAENFQSKKWNFKQA